MPRTKLSAHMDAQKDFTTLNKKGGLRKEIPPCHWTGQGPYPPDYPSPGDDRGRGVGAGG